MVTKVGPMADKERIPGIDIALKDGEVFKVTTNSQLVR